MHSKQPRLSLTDSPFVQFSDDDAPVDVFEHDRPRILHEFRFDTEQMSDYYTKLGYRISCLLAPAYCVVPLLVLPCLHANVRDAANALNVAVTKTEILYVRTRYKTCLRCSCCDQGVIRKTIPIDRIQDVVLKEPAGSCLPAKVLYEVSIETAGGRTGPNGEGIPELTLVGLSREEALRFTETVKSLKRDLVSKETTQLSSPPAAVLGKAVCGGGADSETLNLLRGIKEGIDRLGGDSGTTIEHSKRRVV